MKDITIENFLKNLKNTLDTSQVEVIDLWEADTCAIGIKKKNKLIYISTYNYFENEHIRYDLDFEIINKNKLEVIKERRDRRVLSQPLEYPSAGSVFRNPVGNFAGKLVEEAGLKGYMIGGAQVSEKHANFIINKNNASAEDIYNLIEHVKKEVFNKFGVELRCEQEKVNWE